MTSEQKQPKARVLAYYLPQFHPIPENDEWWGKGFTEWTNVGKAKPLFPGHYQPNVPADLGYYDLRVPETREAQAELARKYGIEGFIYWHYWFGNGKRLLERPFKEVLASGKPDFPFALAWANETWSGTFHGLKAGKNLIEQLYPGDEDYIAHFNTVLPAFKDNRYITCEGKPVFFVYRPEQIPNPKHFVEIWQDLALKNGLKGIYFVGMDGWLETQEIVKDHLDSMHERGFDSMVVINQFGFGSKLPFMYRLVNKIFHKWLKIYPNIRPYHPDYFYTPLGEREDVIPSATPNWDHTPRTGKRGILLYKSTPNLFKIAMEKVVKQVENKPMQKRFIVVKSWNEWAEGNYLEPDLRWGHQYLEALRDAIY